jgi:hypothetical protein
VLHQDPIYIVQHDRWGWVWGFASIGFVYLTGVIILLLAKVIFFGSSALYMANGRLIYMIPAMFSADVSDISAVSYSAGFGLFKTSGSIALKLRDNKFKFLKTDLFDEQPSIVVEKIKLLIQSSAVPSNNLGP